MDPIVISPEFSSTLEFALQHHLWLTIPLKEGCSKVLPKTQIQRLKEKVVTQVLAAHTEFSVNTTDDFPSLLVSHKKHWLLIETLFKQIAALNPRHAAEIEEAVYRFRFDEQRGIEQYMVLEKGKLLFKYRKDFIVYLEDILADINPSQYLIAKAGLFSGR